MTISLIAYIVYLICWSGRTPLYRAVLHWAYDKVDERAGLALLVEMLVVGILIFLAACIFDLSIAIQFVRDHS